MVTVMKIIISISISLIFIVLIVLLLVCLISSQKSNKTNNNILTKNERLRLFDIVTGNNTSSLEVRREATKVLASDKQSWNYSLILCMHPDRGFQHGIDLPMIISHDTIANLPSPTNNAILWELTYWLDEDLGVMYPEKKRSLTAVKMLNKITDPMRDVAKDKLVKSLNVDFGYDQQAWRDYLKNIAGFQISTLEKEAGIENGQEDGTGSID